MISFDIFDTLITRKTYYPQGIFLLVGQQLIDALKDIKDYTYNNFHTLRINAEKDARRYAEQDGREEITLDEIYDLLTIRMSLSKENIECIKKLEIQTEIDNAYPIIKNIKLLKSLVDKGEHIVLISDMYLREGIIREILLKQDPVFEHIPIYISCERKKTKRSGSLYFDVAQLENESFSNWIHYGDNRKSDYLMPRMLGIDGRYIPLEDLTPWESELGKKLVLESNLTLQFCFGAARNIRREKELGWAGKIGSSVGGMILYPYVFWLLQKSVQLGIKRLYFIARDGYILKKVADLIIKNQSLDIKISYIYGSRKAWRTSAFSEIDKQKVIMYLSQEVDFSDSDFAFVDLHGTGITMECLANIIFEKFKVKTRVFYFDLIRDKTSDTHLFISFCSEYSGIVELFCRAPHGSTIGYEEKEGRIAPLLQQVNKVNWEQAGLYEYFEGVELFADKMSQCGWNYWVEDISLVESVLEYCRENPCRELQDFMGNIPHYDGIEEEQIKYAPLLSAKDIFKLYMWRTVEDISEYYSGANLNLSLMRTDRKYVKGKAFLEKHYNFALGRCIHRLKNRKIRCRGDNQKIVIYGAGNVGKRLYEHLKTISGFYIVAWTDIDYEYYQKLGYPVVPLLKTLKMEYQYIIIAMKNHWDFELTRNNLYKLGVSSEKIMEYGDFLEKISGF